MLFEGRAPSPPHIVVVEEHEKKYFTEIISKIAKYRKIKNVKEGIAVHSALLTDPEPLFSPRTVDFFTVNVDLPIMSKSTLATLMVAGVLHNFNEKHFAPKKYKKVARPLERSMRLFVQDQLEASREQVRNYVKRAAFYIANRKLMDVMLKATIANDIATLEQSASLGVDLLAWFRRYLETPYVEIKYDEEMVNELALKIKTLLEEWQPMIEMMGDWNDALSDLLLALSYIADWSQNLLVPRLLNSVFSKLLKFVYDNEFSGPPLNSQQRLMQSAATRIKEVDAAGNYTKLYRTLLKYSASQPFFT